MSFQLVSFQSNQASLGWTETAMREPLAYAGLRFGGGGYMKGGKVKKKATQKPKFGINQNFKI